MDVYRKFVVSSIVFTLIAGCTLGALLIATIGLTQNWEAVEHSIIQAHGHVQIFGWVGLMIMGVAYHVVPRLKATRLYSSKIANSSYAFMVFGIVLRAIGQPLAENAFFSSIMALSGILEVFAVSLFVFVIIKTLRSSEKETEPFERFILAGTFWLLAQTIITATLALYMASEGLTTIPEAVNGAYLHMQIFGFIFMFIFGISLRTLPRFMGLKEPSVNMVKLAFIALNVGIILRIGAEWFQILYSTSLSRVSVGFSGVLEFIGVIAFVYGLNLFKKPAVDMSDLDIDRSYEKFIKIAYVWLPLSVAMLLTFSLAEFSAGYAMEHAFIGAYRHAVVIGFISMMIFGYAARIIPVFRGVKLYSVTLSLATFWIINIGNILRVTSELLVGFLGGGFFVLMGVSGFIEVAAIALFGFNILKTLGTPIEVNI